MAKKFRGNMGGSMNMNNLMKQVQKMQKELEVAQGELEVKTYEASAGGGAVVISMSGKRELLGIKISKEVVDPDDVDMLQDLIVVAYNDVTKQIDEDSNKMMGKMGGSMPAGLF